MNLTDYFDFPEISINPASLSKPSSISSKVVTLQHLKNNALEAGSLAIIGVTESRNSNNPSASNSANIIRKFLYGLSNSPIRKPLLDLGNIKQTSSPANTYSALSEVVAYLSSKGVMSIILGGTQELTWSIYRGICASNTMINITLVDQTLDAEANSNDFSPYCYLNKFLSEPFEKLFSLNLLAYQGYLTDEKLLNQFESNNLSHYRLGYVRGSIQEVEPCFRDSEIVSFDMASIRQGDSPGSVSPSPNGLYAEEACQLARYAGLSNKNKCFGLFDFSPENDVHNQSAHLAAQIVWHYIEASNNKKNDTFSTNNVKRFYVKSPIPNVELVFIKNTSTDKWWMELPGTEKTGGEPLVVACTYTDYKLASKGDIPERWLKILKRVS
ncbi:MAG TPA: arginase family protein [Tenuifilaceae bacterium]|nr:arginase family protein [Tenuifilaceae bacterium]HPE17438.1 arginase family protein [Tenuifilaceae bacterium]HPJ45613.1 arginase family protein [Tenuifilaceae bacterium]HPQ33483.1 arginase family protein [Tenuifilaceae bacterium]HRX66984.1 arginase family protein [Tenuifilaceae bacterium]